jgi:hypothetical protein
VALTKKEQQLEKRMKEMKPGYPKRLVDREKEVTYFKTCRVWAEIERRVAKEAWPATRAAVQAMIKAGKVPKASPSAAAPTLAPAEEVAKEITDDSGNKKQVVPFTSAADFRKQLAEAIAADVGEKGAAKMDEKFAKALKQQQQDRKEEITV